MENKKIALVLLPVFWPNMPPLALASLKGYLASCRIEAKALDYNNFFYNRLSKTIQDDWKRSCNSRLERDILTIIKKWCRNEYRRMIKELTEYDLLGFSCYKSNLRVVIDIAREIKKKSPGIKIVFGGPEIARQYFDKNESLISDFEKIADFFIIGEGEKPLVKYIRGDYGDKKLVLYDEIENPKDLPDPDYSDFDPVMYPRKNVVSLLSSRGCVKRCSFCAERLLYKTFRTYPARNIINQIRKNKDKGVRQFIFHDSLVNGDLAKLEELCDAIIKEFGSVSWEAQIAVNTDMSDVLFEKIKRSGCYHLFVGLESGSNKMLSKMNKGFTTHQAKTFFEKLKEHNLSFGVSMIVGFPEETEADFNESLNFILENKDLIPKIEQVNPFVFYSGIDLPEHFDYKKSRSSIDRARRFIKAIDEAGLKYTKAFMLNLVEPEWK